MAGAGFYVDAKYPDVIACLEADGWAAVRHWTFPTCRLRFVNYAKVQWAYVKPAHIVNHLQHAVLLSQKHELLAHLRLRHSRQHIAPRSAASLDEWRQLFLYAQVLLVLKHPTAFASHLTPALAIAAELMRRNPDPSVARAHGFIMVDAAFLSTLALDGLYSALHREVDSSIPSAQHDLIQAILHHFQACDPQFHFVGTRNLWIAKPSGLSQGRGIELVTSLAELEAIWASPMVVQQYVERPLTIYGRKFDIRQWVLLTDVAPLQVFWYESCYLRFASTEYSLASSTSLQDKAMHLCNNSIQKHATGAAHKEIPDHMWPLHRFQQHLAELGHGALWETSLRPAMQFACAEALASVASKLRRVGQGFEWLGLDFLIDETFRVWLLEVNVSPDVSHSTATTAALVPPATQDLLALVLHQDENRGWRRLDLASVQPPTYAV
ncbi:hypothetical protein SPRG_19801 [Saprolegnia parasitica CBS 223.65]|uniref:Tubulin-tyrosine ligase n=1 Tax=Saprolegnia parasitica (strain CBS 223.65) TaxID=695850 RepID=A0A067CHP9_SAPPC|nr:hypothetical protein SPRG_19801 [Saprolegnia parasitica CBS 223.65]KDO30249.1 hypothetical protein SPRG_19801 [Saprolegnia parasitica CBS 223.65]|eukprot:XP_012199054.1 hypothetical protein SPRG_19801 [Saprolegnia parasitica CBS 223.65]